MADLTGNSGWKQTPNAAIKQRLNWAVTTGNSNQNSSTVIISYWLKKDPNIQNLETSSSDCRFKIECGGKTVSDSQIDQYYSRSMTLLPNNTEKCVARHTFTIPHNPDGTKSIKIKVSGGFGGTSINYYSLTVSKTLTLPAIKRASTISGVSNVVIGNNTDVSWTPYSKDFYYRLKFVYGQHSYIVGDPSEPIFPNSAPTANTNTIYTYCGFTVPTELINEIINSESAQMMVYLYTFSDSEYTKQVGSVSSKSFVITVPNNLLPTIESRDWNTTTKSNGIMADGFVDFSFSIVASGIYSSTIKAMHVEYSLLENGVIKKGSDEFVSQNITDNGDGTYSCSLSTGYIKFGFSQNSNNSLISFDITAEDSRGRLSLPVILATNLYSYSQPLISLFRAERNSTNSTVVDVWLSARCSPVRLSNSIHGIINYRRIGSDTWKSAGYIHSTDQHPVASVLNAEQVSIEPVDGDIFEENYSYEIQAYVFDSVGNVITALAYIGVTTVLIDLKAGGNGLGIGKMAETDAVEVALPSKFFDVADFSDQVTFNEQVEFGMPMSRTINDVQYTIADMIKYDFYHVNNSGLASGFELNNSNIPMRFGRIGDIVHVTGNVNVTTSISLNDVKTGKTFFTLPVGYRPTNDVYVECRSSNLYTWVLHIDTSGNMKISRYGKSDFEAIPANTTWFPFNVTFFVYGSSTVAYS